MATKITKSQLREMIKEAVLKEQHQYSIAPQDFEVIRDLVLQINSILDRYARKETGGYLNRSSSKLQSELKAWMSELTNKFGSW